MAAEWRFEPTRLDDLARIAQWPPGENRARALDVARHFLLQRVQRRKFPLFAQPRDELDLHLLPIDIAGKIEEMGLQQGRAVVGGRANAETGDYIESPSRDAGPHGIDAEGETIGRLEGDVGG